MLHYNFITVSRYDGTGRSERAIEVFNTATGTTLTICRRLPWEPKQTWINRAIERARFEVA